MLPSKVNQIPFLKPLVRTAFTVFQIKLLSLLEERVGFVLSLMLICFYTVNKKFIIKTKRYFMPLKHFYGLWRLPGSLQCLLLLVAHQGIALQQLECTACQVAYINNEKMAFIHKLIISKQIGMKRQMWVIKFQCSK